MMSVPASCRSLEGLRDLGALLAHAEDEVRLRDEAGVAALGDHVERALVAERRADPLEDARHRLDVVGEHLGPCGEHLGEVDRVAREVGHEDLHPGAGRLAVDLADRLRVEPGALVGQVVAGDAGDGRVAQLHPHHRLGDAARLVDVVVGGLAGVDLAEVAAPRALRAADEEGGLAVLPALVDVRAAGLLADRVQLLALHEALQLPVLGTHLRARLDPLGLALDRRLGVADLEAQHPAPVGCGAHAATAASASARNRRVIGSTRSSGVTVWPSSRRDGRHAGVADAAGDDLLVGVERVASSSARTRASSRRRRRGCRWRRSCSRGRGRRPRRPSVRRRDVRRRRVRRARR